MRIGETRPPTPLEEMNKTTDGSENEPNPDPEPGPGEAERREEGWLDRLKAAVGMRPAGSMREELADALATEKVDGFSPEERAMLANILRLREVRVDDAMVPRADIDAVELDVTLAGLLEAFQKSGHSRMPVYRETLDDPVGFVHIKDLMGYLIRAAEVAGAAKFDFARIDLTRTLAATDLVRNILFVPPSMPVTALLASMQASHMQLALVIDEYGGTDGLVSLEDVVEMVVGDIEDEHDDDASTIMPERDGMFLVDARADLDDVAAAIGADLALGEEAEDADTIGGLVVGLLGRVPVRGELVELPGGFEAEILDADPRRIKKLRVYRRPEGSARPDPRRRRPPPAEPTGGA
jgi:CBS domain containing-hemolysin-like protein